MTVVGWRSHARRAGSMAVLAGLLAAGSATLATGATAAEPAGSSKLNAVKTEKPRITVVGASASGVLYQVSTVGEDYQGTTWVKPTGAPAYQVPVGFYRLSGDKIYALAGYQLIGDPVTRTCAGLPGPADGYGADLDSPGFFKGYAPFGWLTDNGQRVTATAAGCTLSGTYEQSVFSQKLAATDATGYVTVTRDPSDFNQYLVEYRTYANPGQPVLLSSGRETVRATTVALAGTSVSWATFNFQGDSTVYQATAGIAGSGHVVGEVTGDVVRTSTAGTSVSWDRCSAGKADNCTSGSFTSTGVASSLAGTRSVASNGTDFVFDRAGSAGVQAGIDKAAAVSASVPHQLVQVIQKQTPLSGKVSINGNRVLYSDGRGRDTLYQRSYAARPGSVLLGEESSVAHVARGTQVETEGNATAYVDDVGSVWLIKPNGQRKLVFQATVHGLRANSDVARYAPFGVSGRWVLWTKEEYYGTSCPSEGCVEEWGIVNPILSDTATGTSVEIEDAVGVAAGKLYRYNSDGLVVRDLATGTESVLVAAPGRIDDFAVDGQYAVWRGTTDGVTTLSYKNLATGVVATRPADLYDTKLKVAGGRIAYQAKVGTDQYGTTLTVMDLATGAKKTFGQSAYRFDLAPQAVAWIGDDQTARIASLR